MDKVSRRKALKALAISAPVVWAKPTVNSVVLPVHANTSVPTCPIVRTDSSVTATHCSCGCENCPTRVYYAVTINESGQVVIGPETTSDPRSGTLPYTGSIEILYHGVYIALAFCSPASGCYGQDNLCGEGFSAGTFNRSFSNFLGVNGVTYNLSFDQFSAGTPSIPTVGISNFVVTS